MTMGALQADTLYPPTPTGVPAGLARPSGRYHAQVIAVLVALAGFAALYLGLIAATAYGVVYALGLLGQGGGRGGIYGAIALAVAFGMLFVFLCKGLFKRRRFGGGDSIELDPAVEPRLFAFVERLCSETRAPHPHRIIITGDVNAAVQFNQSFFNLIWPSKKNLIMGLGLVNALTLSELKAVLAHEFGHFSQRSMRLGNYVYMCNRILVDMIYGRDSWDDALAAMRRNGDIRISLFGHTIGAVVWVLRRGLGLLFYGLTLVDRGLSRQMEFNADLVAVSVTGSDALIHALSRLRLADAALSQTYRDLIDASDHGLVTRDLFVHQTEAFEVVRERLGKPDFGRRPELPDDESEAITVFDDDESEAPSMWATHPPNTLRERNAKRIYVRSPVDDRSPWLLFSDPESLRAEVTRDLYTRLLPGKETPAPSDPAEVQAFIEADRAERRLDPRYESLYVGRPLQPVTIDPARLEAESDAAQPLRWRDLIELDAATMAWSERELRVRVDTLYSDELLAFAEARKKRLDELQRLAAYVQGRAPVPKKGVDVGGRRLGPQEIPGVVRNLEQRLNEDDERLFELDRRVLQVYLRLARELGDDRESELLHRYGVHLSLQSMGSHLAQARLMLVSHLQAMQQRRERTPADVDALGQVCAAASAALEKVREVSGQVTLPALSNLEDGTSLGAFLFEGETPVPRHDEGDLPKGYWIDAYLSQVALVLDRLARLQVKSLGALLKCQEGIEADWRASDELPEPVVEGDGELNQGAS